MKVHGRDLLQRAVWATKEGLKIAGAFLFIGLFAVLAFLFTLWGLAWYWTVLLLILLFWVSCLIIGAVSS